MFVVVPLYPEGSLQGSLSLRGSSRIERVVDFAAHLNGPAFIPGLLNIVKEVFVARNVGDVIQLLGLSVQKLCERYSGSVGVRATKGDFVRPRMSFHGMQMARPQGIGSGVVARKISAGLLIFDSTVHFPGSLPTCTCGNSSSTPVGRNTSLGSDPHNLHCIARDREAALEMSFIEIILSYIPA
jgi:hypothetical protein